jgi:aspartate-semialdehyde dehydrogenase
MDAINRRHQAVQESAQKTVAIVGATGAVGVEFLNCLAEREFPVQKLKLFASKRSTGRTLMFKGRPIVVEELTANSFDGVDIALFSAGGDISKHYAPFAVKAGAIVVDNSSAFRLQDGVPLVVPEINPQEIAHHKGIVANPNCSTIIALTPLWPVHQVNRLRRISVATYQAASGAGAAAMKELEESTRAYLDGKDYAPKVLPHPYAFNLFSHNSEIDPETGYNGEEIKVMRESRKIFAEPHLRIAATCVRVPVLRAHAISISFECERPISPDRVRELLSGAPGLQIVDDRAHNLFPMPRDASHQDDILVGRIRQDLSDPSGHSISLFVAGDQLLKGAALNAVQIAELL